MFTYTAKYPDELPIIEIENEDNFDDIVEKDELLNHLIEQVRNHSTTHLSKLHINRSLHQHEPFSPGIE